MLSPVERNSQLANSNPPTLRHHLTALLESANSFQHSFALNWGNLVEKLESFDSAIESRCAEVEKRESLVDLRLGEVEKKEEELGCLEAKLRYVEKREEECEQVFAELRAAEDCVDDRIRRAEAERRNLERWVKEEEERIEGMKRESSREVEERRKAVEERERECKKKLEEFEGLKSKELGVEKRRKEVELKELQCKKKLEEVERLKESLNKEFKLNEKEVEERRKLVELKEIHMEEIERKNQSVSEELKLKESELEKGRKDVESKEMIFKRRLDELFRLKQSVSEVAEKREKELEMREKEMELKEMEFKKKMDELERWKMAASGAVKLKEIELEIQHRGVLREFNKKLEEIERSKQITSEALKLKETELEKRQKELELEELEFKKKLGEIEKLKQSGFEALKMKEKELQLEFNKKFEEHERSKLVNFQELERKEKELKKQQKGLELKEVDLKKKSEELELKLVNRVEKQRKDLELKEKNLDEQINELRGKEMEIKKKSEELHLREQQCESRSKENELGNRKIDEQMKMIDWEKNQLVLRHDIADIDNEKFMRRVEELELKEKQLEERLREVELREKKADDTIYTQVKREPQDANDISADAGLCFRVKMDGKALQIFLNERERDLEYLRDELTGALSLSPNPAKLVLDAIQGFYPPHFRKGDVEFKADVVRKSCILLLEQLQVISPPINTHVRNEATELAFDWKRKMRADYEHSMEVLGFLQLLAAYNLASEFNSDDLLHCLETVALNRKAPELFRVLGFSAHVSSFIETLVRKKKFIEAVGFVFAFDLVSEFPPVPLLKDFLKFSKNGRRRLDDFDAKIESLYQRREDAKAVLKCVQDHRLESHISPKQLQQQINDLGRQIAEMQKKMPAPGCRIRSTPPDVRTQSSPNVAAAGTSVSKPKSAPSTSTKVDSTAAVLPAIKASSQIGIKRPRCLTEDDSDVPSAEILAQKPIGASGNEGTISDSLHHENSNDHQLDLKTAECAFDAIKRFCSLEHENGKPASLGIFEARCISLLENLRNVPDLFDPRAKGEVLKFATDWKAQLMKKRSDQPNVVLFAEFLAAFGLASSFPANDLLLLLDSISCLETSSDLYQLLGLANTIPDFIKSLIQRNQRIVAAKYIHVLGMNDKFPIIKILYDHWCHFKRTGTRLCEKHNHSITSQIEAIREEKDALVAIVNCFEAYNIQSQGEMSPQILRERIVQLEKQKVRKEAELDKEKHSAKGKIISLQRPKKNCNNIRTEATGNAGKKGPEICPKKAVVSALVAGINQSPDFASATGFSSADKPSLARTVNLPVDSVRPLVVACSSSPAMPNTVASNSLPSSNPTHKLNIGSTPLLTAAKAAVAPSSTGGPPSTSVPKTQPQRQAENKRRKVVVSSGPLMPNHNQPFRHQR